MTPGQPQDQPPPRGGQASRLGPAGDLDELEQRDPGLARERTSLAWTRTAISFAALGGALLKVSVPPGLVILAMAVLIWRAGQRSGPRRQWLMMVTIVVVAVVALVVSLLARSPAHPLQAP